MTQPPPAQPPPSQWQAPNMLLPTPQQFGNTAATLDKMLRWLRGLTLVQGGLLGLAWAAFLLFLLLDYQGLVAQTKGNDADFLRQTHWLLVGTYFITGALTLLCYALGVKLLDWCREYLNLLRGVTLGGGLKSPARLGALTRTFHQYITASQWALPALGVLMALFPLLLFPYDAHIGMSELLVVGLMILLAFAPACIINGLLLAALRRWLKTTSQRMRGLNVPIHPSAQTVSNWFIFVLVLVGLGIMSSLPSLLSPLSIALPNLLKVNSGPSPISTVTVILIALAAFVLVAFQLAQQVLTFLALLHSRSYAEQSAALLDTGPRPTPTDLPMNSGNPFKEKVKLSKSPNV